MHLRHACTLRMLPTTFCQPLGWYGGGRSQPMHPSLTTAAMSGWTAASQKVMRCVPGVSLVAWLVVLTAGLSSVLHAAATLMSSAGMSFPWSNWNLASCSGSEQDCEVLLCKIDSWKKIYLYITQSILPVAQLYFMHNVKAVIRYCMQ